MSDWTASECALLLVPHGRDTTVATRMLAEASIDAKACANIECVVTELDTGAGFVLVSEEALTTADASPLALWLVDQEEWSDLPFILLTTKGGGLERNPAASRYINLLGNVTFLERPFHPTTLVSLAHAALRGRRRQYEARARLEELRQFAATLEDRVCTATAERESALERLHEAQKLEMLGQLTGGVAHDFNNLLTPIMGVLDRLNRRGGEDERSTRLIAGALESAERAKTLVQRLLGFARRQALQTRPVDLAELLEGMRDLIASSVGATVELRMNCEEGLPAALIDPHQLELALLNLCVNARDAMPISGRIRIRAANRPGGSGAADAVDLMVCDEGTGIAAEIAARVFEPFFTTKEIGHGSGLGLAQVHGFAT
ncbi:MAG: ATP-binding protein, partial [Novosphingobium sp.]